MKTRILALIATVVCLASCAVFKPDHSEHTYLTLKIFQTLGPNEALATKTTDYSMDVVKIVKPYSSNEMYYDGLVIKDYFVLIDTYSYETVNGTTKTVPVYIKKKDYKAQNEQ